MSHLQHPRWGKDKLAVLQGREKLTVSTSMVERILVDLKRRGTLHEPPKPAVLRQARRKLRNRPWAIRKPKYWGIEQPMDLHDIPARDHIAGTEEFQDDTATHANLLRVDLHQISITGRLRWLLRVSWIRCWTARRFPIKALRVDGGSEFAAEFEEARQQKELPLFVLPPTSPKLRGLGPRGIPVEFWLIVRGVKAQRWKEQATAVVE